MRFKRLTALVMAVATVFCISASALAVNPQEARLAAAREIAYMDPDAASVEMREAILEARETIINSESWVADGYTGGYVTPDGLEVEFPHFSELFPGWDLPTVDVSSLAGLPLMAADNGSWDKTVTLTNSSTAPAFAAFNFEEELDTTVKAIDSRTYSCNVVYINMLLGQVVNNCQGMVRGSSTYIRNTPENITAGKTVVISVRAYTNNTPGQATFNNTCW